MKTLKSTENDIDKYFAEFPVTTREMLELVRTAIRGEVPEAGEKISYGIPTFTLYGNLVHYAGYKNHIGFYPGASGIANFKDEFVNYKFAKGSVQFPTDRPMPLELIRKIVRFRVQENLNKAYLKR